MIRYEPLREHAASPQRLVELLGLAKQTLLGGMADMEEYGDMLKWGLPKDGMCRNVHVYHPDWCSFDDRFAGTIHYHPGTIRGTVLLGAMDHFTYEPTPGGDRFHEGQGYHLARHTSHQTAGTAYELPSHVPHWLAPTELTLTYFEEEDTEEMGDLIDPQGVGPDEHTWDQAQADALLPVLLEAIDERIAGLLVKA